ncbi:matrixin family metalloprotease [Paenarthrobacter sp. PH39-S1]|uniref:matrixin family metalloprotease n=1 Tax=Paenarthrobacter sp. PH39-S1 TaxID=3046204 RepID=UPI0024BB4F0B|nr:matrixin family metalloprotease [Paenarthrobacter sp. PH39-S1]MDJ0357614.1 matrixin family metalloprotease [Paenarthrobacter sp. PH39-S1]
MPKNSVQQGTESESSRSYLPLGLVQAGDAGPDVQRTYNYLEKFGYLPNAQLAQRYPSWQPGVAQAPTDPTRFDSRLEEAIRLFQRTYGLAETGQVDQPTRELMKQPRCGVPDNVSVLGQFVVGGTRWPGLNVTYSHTNFSPDLPVADVRSTIRGAFDRWSAAAPLHITEKAGGSGDGDIRVGFYAGDHGDGYPFDGSGTAAGNILAHCFYPPGPGDNGIGGDCHFDEAETWSTNLPPAGTDLPTVALHELGHGLGLNHSEVKDSVMYAYYGGARRELTADDIAGIRSIYGGYDWSGINDNWASLGGFFPVGAPVSAVSRLPGQLDLFVVGNDGRVYTSWWTSGQNWSGVQDNWRPIGGFFPPGAPVAAVSRTPNNLDLFVCGNDGRVYTSWWYAGVDWSGVNDNWRSIGGFFPNGAHLSAVARTGNNLDVFVCGNDGRVYTSWWYAGVDWSGVNDNWRSIGGFFPNGAPVAAVARTGNNLDLFVCGNDGRVYTSWWYAGADWSGVNDNWRSIGGFFPNGAHLSAVARTGNNLDVFVCGNDGRVYTSWWYAGVDWSGVNDNWRSIGGFFPNGAPVAAVSRTPNNLDLFVCGNDGRVYTSWWYAGVDWSGVNDNWRSIGGFFPNGAPLSAVARTGNNLDVFVCGNDGRVYTSWWSG